MSSNLPITQAELYKLLSMRYIQFERIVFIQDFHKAKELATNEDFLGRFGDGIYVAEVRGHDNKPTGVAMTQGQVWKTLRRFSLQTLKAIF